MCQRECSKVSTDTNEEMSLNDMMMDNIVKFGKFSFELEEKREQSLINQSSQMMTAFSIFSVAMYMLIPILINENSALTKKLLFCTGIVSLFLIASLVCALFSQWRYKYKTMPNISVFYEQVSNEPDKYQTLAQFCTQWKYQLAPIQDNKKSNNDKRVKFLIASIVLFFMAIATEIISVLALIFISIN